MADRVKKAWIQDEFKELARLLGKPTGQIWSQDPVTKKNKAKVGAWELDYNPVYGGYNIEEIMNEGGGVTMPFGEGRKKPAQFHGELKSMIRALRLKNGDKY